MNTQNNNQTTFILSIVAIVISLITFWLGIAWHFTSSDSISADEMKTLIKEIAQTKTAVPTNNQPTQQPAAAAWCWVPSNQPAQQAPANNGQLEVSKFKDFYNAMWGVKWNKDAKVTLIYFGDVECPFCQRHTNNKTLDEIAKKYGDKLNLAYAHYPLWFHPLAPKAAEAIECVKKSDGFDKWWKYMETLYAQTAQAGWKPTLDVIKASAKADWIDETKLTTCLDSGEMTSKVKDQSTFWSSVWVTGTPWNVIVDNKTGKYTKVSWAAPASNFDAAIESMLK